MIIELENSKPGITFGDNKIVSTRDIKLRLDGLDVGKYVKSACIELDAKKGFPEIHLKMVATGFPNEIEGKVFITFEDHTFECVKVHENLKK